MRVMDLKSLVRPKKYRSYRGQVGRTAPNVLNRNFAADKPNQKWVTDVTEFKVGDKKLYLSPILDLFNGEIISYTIMRRPVFDLVKAMLVKGLERLRPTDQLILHSDQGWQYQLPSYQTMLKPVIEQSMSRKGNCLDNASMESFFAVLKSECFYTKKFHSIEELEKEIHDYIHYYNHDRIKMKLKGLSPIQFRTQSLVT